MSTTNLQADAIRHLQRQNTHNPPMRSPLVGTVIAPPEEPIRLEPLPVDRMLTSKQVAAILGVSEETLKKWRQRRPKDLRFYRYFEDAIRYRLSDVMKFLEASAVKP